MGNNRDISVQPFATSSILQHHYQSTGSQMPLAMGNTIGGGEFSHNKQQPTDGGSSSKRSGNVSNESSTVAADNGQSAANNEGSSSLFNILGASNGQVSLVGQSSCSPLSLALTRALCTPSLSSLRLVICRYVSIHLQSLASRELPRLPVAEAHRRVPHRLLLFTMHLHCCHTSSCQPSPPRSLLSYPTCAVV